MSPRPSKPSLPAGVSRRRLLTLPLAAAGGLALGPMIRLARARSGEGELPFEEFLERWKEVGDAVLEAAHPNEDRYLHQLCSMISSLSRPELPRLQRKTYEADGMASGPAWYQERLSIIELRLDPGAVIPAHNHVGFTFVTLGLEGECEYRHFETRDAPPPRSEGTSDEFTAQVVRAGTLRPGRLTHLSRTRANIHWFRAGEQGATILDFGTQFDGAGGGYEEFSALDFDAEPFDRDARLHHARWIGNPYR